MKIEITGFNTKELIEVLKAFPVGKVVSEDKKAFWDSENKLPDRDYKQDLPSQIARSQSPDFFGNMKKSLFEAFS